MKGLIIIEIDDAFFNHLKNRTQLILRGNPEAGTEIILVDRDREIINEFFNNCRSELLNKLGISDQAEAYEGTSLIINLNERQIKEGLEKMEGILKLAVEEYLLMRWFDGIKRYDLKAPHESEYKTQLGNFKFNSTQNAFVTPKSRPYF